MRALFRFLVDQIAAVGTRNFVGLGIFRRAVLPIRPFAVVETVVVRVQCSAVLTADDSTLLWGKQLLLIAVKSDKLDNLKTRVSLDQACPNGSSNAEMYFECLPALRGKPDTTSDSSFLSSTDALTSRMIKLLLGLGLDMLGYAEKRWS